MIKNQLSKLCKPVLKSLLATATVFTVGTSQINAQLIYGLSNNNLIRFNVSAPGSVLQNIPITGITAGQSVVGMDFRPNTGELFALGYNSGTGQAQVYVIDRATAAATTVGASITLALGTGKVSFDFNPTVDRIRVTSSNNANLRLNPITGGIAATDLNQNYAVGDVNFGTDPSVGTVAYTNSYIASTSTTLYAYDDSLNILATQIPPNNGTLNTIGASGISVNLADQSSDLDIFYNTTSQLNEAYFAANTGINTNDNLFTVNLTTGAATNVGAIGLAVQDIACFISRNVPSNITGQLMYGINTGNFLISFDSNLPSVIRKAVPVTGITVGQTIVGFDSRPLTGELFAMGYSATTFDYQLYKVNRTTGVATAVNATPIALALGTGKVGFDFNPTVDRIRVTGSNNNNFRLNPITGAVAATDLPQAYAVGDPNFGTDPSIGTVAYTNSYIASTSTTLYTYDDSLNVLTTQIPPNNGTLNTIGSSGIAVNLTDQSSDMDISFNNNTSLNTAYLSANTGVSTFDNFYTVNLTTGAASLVGKIGNGVAVRDIAAFITLGIPSNITGELIHAITSGNMLIRFDSDVPSIVRNAVPVTGITVGQAIVGMDYRPLNNALYVLGYNNTTNAAQLYILNRATGVATVVNATPITLMLGTGDVAMDFNPVVDRIRVVGANDANYRLFPATGLLAATDLNINFATGDPNFGANPNIGTVAYSNSFAGTLTTTLYDYDNTLNILATQLPPNNGTLNTLGSSGIVLNPADATADLDIYFDMMAAVNRAYLSANVGVSTFDNLYTVNLTSGAATLVGKIGFGVAVRDIAIFPADVSMLRLADEFSFQAAAESNFMNLYPNPMSETGNISFSTPADGKVKITITDITGREVMNVVDKDFAAGTYTEQFSATSMKSGLYFVNLYINEVPSQTLKVVIK